MMVAMRRGLEEEEEEEEEEEAILAVGIGNGDVGWVELGD